MGEYLSDIEVVPSVDVVGDWVVEAQTGDGGVRRVIFTDADAQERATQYAEILRSQGLLVKRRYKTKANDQ